MLPRYRPLLGLRDWGDFLCAADGDSAEWCSRLVQALQEPYLPPHWIVFDKLRSGLRTYFSALSALDTRRTVILPAQICHAVPAALTSVGLALRYVDTDDTYPVPGPEQYAAAIDADTLAVLVAPIYGHIQADWSPLLRALGQCKLVLDLAQGLGLATRVAALSARADAVGYSFGLGKGLDAGGGLLLTRRPVDPTNLPQASKVSLTSSLAKAAALRGLAAIGLYRAIVGRLDRAIEPISDAECTGALLPAIVCRIWRARIAAYSKDVEIARHRARALSRNDTLHSALRHPEVYFDPAATHLRQIIRLRKAGDRDAVIADLRRAGVDCAPAGEPLPSVAHAERLYPNSFAFRSDAIRLPFLGRIDQTEFDQFEIILERIVARRLS